MFISRYTKNCNVSKMIYNENIDYTQFLTNTRLQTRFLFLTKPGKLAQMLTKKYHTLLPK